MSQDDQRRVPIIMGRAEKLDMLRAPSRMSANPFELSIRSRAPSS